MGRGLSCTCRSARSCWTTAPPWACGPRSTRWAGAPAPEARSTAPPTRPGCAGCTGPGPAGRVRGVRVGGRGEDAATLPASPHLPRLISFRVFLILCLSPCSTLGLYLTVFLLPFSEFSTLLPFALSSVSFSFSFHLPTSSLAQVTGLHGLRLSHISRVRLCDPMDCSLPGSSVHGVSQARILGWAAISFSRGSS